MSLDLEIGVLESLEFSRMMIPRRIGLAIFRDESYKLPLDFLKQVILR